jgi:ERCC4-type nuclease
MTTMSPISIIVDDREATLYTSLEQKCGDRFVLSKSTLPLGDIIVRYNTGQSDTPLEWIIERKTLSDLLASIRDGRYEEQSHRLIHSSGLQRHNIIYLVEGILNTVSNTDKNLIHSTMVSLNAFKGFSVIRTSGVQETADFIVNMAAKIQRNMEQRKFPWWMSSTTPSPESQSNDGIGGELSGGGETVPSPYCSVVKKVKKDNITPANIGEIVLCQIPGISSVSAVAIMAKFGTIKRLIESVSQDPACMNDIVITSANGTRKIGKNILANIRQFLCPEGTA